MKKLLVVIGIIVVLAVVFMHWVLPGKVEQSMNINLPHDPYVVSEEANRLHDSLFIADLHSDSLLWKRDLTGRSDIGHMDLPRLQEGNVALQVFSATTKSPAGLNYESNESSSDNITRLAIASFWPPKTWGSIYERAVYQLEKLHDLARRSELTVVTSKQEMRSFIARRDAGEAELAGVYLIEGAHPLEGDLKNLDLLFDQGLRIIGLTHFFDNEMGGSLHGISDEGLNEFGRSVIIRANELGLIGIGYWDAAVCDTTPRGVVKSIRYAIDLIGVDHVALGSDYDGATAVMFDTSELAVLTDAMLQVGFTTDEIRSVMGENVKWFLLQNLPDDSSG